MLKNQPMHMERYFMLDQQWNVLHIPERPNGFAILIVGDVSHYVDEDTSFWRNHPGRNRLLSDLLEKGYTVVNTHCFGRHWGSPEAVRFLQRLVYVFLKQEILNPYIHLLGEGMGSLALLKLANLMPSRIRSVALITPCVSLQAYAKTEKENRLFYKRLLKEVSDAYDIPKDDVEETVLQKSPMNQFVMSRPCHIFQDITSHTYPVDIHARPFYEYLKQTGENAGLTLYSTQLSGGHYETMVNFFQSNEQYLDKGE
ncbi:hypothetical protein G4V62_06150 [Bacillaceae bacterium SIJ1]|uniref:hypothetical protein n=1 Tax=Litoribacterium kuwaitense TaxID=1398745 RepID=UPI0013ED477B|nr:hypothetical protein [Litoribacterium kuwaitense]NGP44559.1 hypothetical protein [Litoribacterium kuwaitense]